MPHHFSTVQSNVLGTPPVRQLVQALGGSSAVPAIFDGFTPGTLVSSKVHSWPDARGATGFAPPQVTVSGGADCTYNSGTGGVSFNGTTNLLDQR